MNLRTIKRAMCRAQCPALPKADERRAATNRLYDAAGCGGREWINRLLARMKVRG